MLLSYDFQSGLTPTTTAAGFTGTAFTSGDGISNFTTASAGSSPTNVSQGSITAGGTISTGTVASNSSILNVATAAASSLETSRTSGSTRFTQFSVSAAAGFIPQLDSISLDISKGNTGGTRGFVLLYSTDNFATFGTVGEYTVSEANTSFSRVSFDLGALPTNAENIAFRFNVVTASSSQSIRLDNVVLTAVPEPSAVVLGLLGLGVVVIRRRR